MLPHETLPRLSAGPGAGGFACFSTSEREKPATRAALRQRPVPVRIVAPGPGAEAARAMATRGQVRIAPAPLPPHKSLARARVILCAARAGTLSLALLAGVPVLVLPHDLE
jgi:hypothetical protein